MHGFACRQMARWFRWPLSQGIAATERLPHLAHLAEAFAVAGLEGDLELSRFAIETSLSTCR